MNKTIRKACELATGFSIFGNGNYRIQERDQYAIHAAKTDPPQWFLDALAAQLVRQVDALDHYFIDSDRHGTAKVWQGNNENMYRIAKSNDGDKGRTLNTITVIIESKVLENTDGS